MAEAIGTPLTTFVTINLGLTDCDPAQVSQTFGDLRDRYFSRWLRQAGSKVKPTYVWVIETAGGCVCIHWLLHIPSGSRATFEESLHKWVARLVGLPHSSNAIQIKTAKNPRGLSYYLLKGINPAYAPFYGITPIPQGTVFGRRSGFSKNIGPSAKLRLREEGRYKARRFVRWPDRASPI